MQRFFRAALFFCGIAIFSVSHAQVMQSTNFQIESDSINVGGGFSSSTNFNLESSVGEIATGPSEGSLYSLRAGYQQMDEIYLALSAADNVLMDTDIPGLVGGSSNGSTTVTVTTDDRAGYELSIVASNAPAMQSVDDTIADYVPAGAVPDIAFVTTATDAHFSFSPFGDDVVTRFQTNGSVCGVSGSASSTACWDGMSTVDTLIAQGAAANHPTGTDTSIYFKVGIGSSVIQTSGTYVATSTITLLPR